MITMNNGEKKAKRKLITTNLRYKDIENNRSLMVERLGVKA
jgi:hypothetical protein